MSSFFFFFCDVCKIPLYLLGWARCSERPGRRKRGFFHALTLVAHLTLITSEIFSRAMETFTAEDFGKFLQVLLREESTENSACDCLETFSGVTSRFLDFLYFELVCRLETCLQSEMLYSEHQTNDH